MEKQISRNWLFIFFAIFTSVSAFAECKLDLDVSDLSQVSDVKKREGLIERLKAKGFNPVYRPASVGLSLRSNWGNRSIVATAWCLDGGVENYLLSNSAEIYTLRTGLYESLERKTSTSSSCDTDTDAWRTKKRDDAFAVSVSSVSSCRAIQKILDRASK